MATVTFTLSAGGNFGSDGNWSSNHHPVAGDTANITSVFAGAAYTVSLTDAEAAALVDLGASNATLAIESGGVLTAGSINLTAGTIDVISGGEITGNTSITDGSGVTTNFIDGTLDGVTWQGTLGLTGVTQSSLLTITTGLTGLTVLNAAGNAAGEIDVTGLGATLDFGSTMTLDGTVTNLLINLGGVGGSGNTEFISVGSGDVLTFGSLVSVVQTGAGSNVKLDDVSTDGTIVNDGTMSFATGAGSSAEINPQDFTNNGTILVDGGILNGESLDISTFGSLADNGLISVTDFGRVGLTATITPGALTIDGTISASGTSTIDVNTNASGTGSILLASSSTADVFNFTGNLTFLDASGDLALEQPSLFTGNIIGLSRIDNSLRDVVDLLHTNVTAIQPYTGDASGGTLTVMNGTDIAASLTLVGNYTGTSFGFASDSNGGFDIFISCFAQGTGLDTPDGPVAVEDLNEGDLVLVAGGAPQAVRWIGRRRINLARHPEAASVRPVRIKAHAFAPGEPRRDLLLSPDHALFVDGVLIPVKYLINGVSIAQVAMDAVTYYHIELDEHDILLAEGLPAESYLDVGDRGNFQNGNHLIALHPRFGALRREAGGCAPLILTGTALQAVRDRLTTIASTPDEEPTLAA